LRRVRYDKVARSQVALLAVVLSAAALGGCGGAEEPSDPQENENIANTFVRRLVSSDWQSAAPLVAEGSPAVKARLREMHETLTAGVYVTVIPSEDAPGVLSYNLAGAGTGPCELGRRQYREGSGTLTVELVEDSDRVRVFGVSYVLPGFVSEPC
jgi:hypothetical protein